MSLVNVANMIVLDNPAPFGNPLQFEITFECLQPLEDGTSQQHPYGAHYFLQHVFTSLFPQ